MKQKICALVAILCMLFCTASADKMYNEEYTDVTSVMTQDSVVSLELFTEEPVQEPSITLQQPDEKSMALLEDIYDFVWRRENRPVRYYDEETQQKIQDLVPGMDIDALHLTEFMAQEMYGELTHAVVVERLLDVDYQPGQLVIVVLGYEQEDGTYRWFPYRGEVPELGMIRYTIPVEDYMELVGQPQVIYHVLTNRVGARGEVLKYSASKSVRIETPSKGYRDISYVHHWYSTNGETIEDNFRIYLVEKTREMEREIDRIGAYLAEELPGGETNKIINWFPEERVSEAQLLLGDVDRETLIGYDIVAVMSEDYKDTYGDVATENRFTAAYSPERRMVAMLGFPLEAEELPDLPPEELEKITHFEWYCLRTEAIENIEKEDIVEIVFKQLVIPDMETEPALLVVLSEPLVEPED